MNLDRYSILRKGRAKLFRDKKVAEAKRQERKKFIKHLVRHPLPWFILMVAIVYICEAVSS